MTSKIKILCLCSDLLDFDGSHGDIEFLLYRLKQYNLEFEYYKHLTWEEVDLLDYDMVYAGICPQKYENIYLENLKTRIKNVQQYIEEFGIMLAIEQSFLFLGMDLEDDNNFLNVIPIDVKKLNKYAIGNMLIDTRIKNFKSKINGFVNTRYKFDIISKKIKPFGEVLLGVSFFWEQGTEGIVYKNFIGTHLRGPILPRNYDLCDYLISSLYHPIKLSNISSIFEINSKNFLTKECEEIIASNNQKKEYTYVS